MCSWLAPIAAVPDKDPGCERSRPVNVIVADHVKLFEQSPPRSVGVTDPVHVGMPMHVKGPPPPPPSLLGSVPWIVPTTVVSANAVAPISANTAAATRAALPACAMLLPL